ncbi:translocation/assembly module TamB domain-containing protein [Bdellovibrio sp. HCB337]|uniref:translocation/assembly module TamB domain-containing protein n=1 Tax=Bdellovibrio sp. HCB337 TaxID=3394358 RepID=UPI0039A4A7CD
MKRVLLILLPPLVFLIALGAALKYWAIPNAESWALRKVKSFSETNLPVVIEAESIKFQFLKGAASVEKISVTAKPEFKKYLENATVESLKVNLDIFQLFTGRVQVSAILLDSPEVRVQLDPFLETPSKPQALPLNQVFEFLDKLPVERVFVHNLNLALESKKQNTSADLQGADLLLGNHQNSVTARVDVPSVALKVLGHGPIQSRFDVSVVLGRDSLRILRAGARYGDSEIILKGDFEKFSQVTLHPRANLEATGELKLQEIMQQVRPIFSGYKLPGVLGEATAKVNIQIDGTDKITGKVDAKTRDVKIAAFSLGNASIQGIFKGNSLIFPDVVLNHPAGTAKLTNTELELNDTLAFKTHAKVSSLDMQKLFTALNLHEIPVWMNLQGDLPCQGQFKSPIKVTCDGNIAADNILVTSDFKNKKAVIADVARMTAKGQVEITDKAVTYKAQLQLGSNTGESSGTVDFAKGFKIKYSSPRLDFSNIRNLANLKFKGYGSLEGGTTGDSHAAVFDMKLKTHDFSFEDYYLGQLSGTLSYKASHLYLDDVQGLLPRSSYQGALEVDLHNSRIVGRIKAPTLELSDIARVFESHYAFPLSVRALGAADMSFSGPLDFWKMSYQLDSKFRSGQLAGESFDELVLNAQSTQGQLQLQKAYLKKNLTTITATGGISSQQDMNIKVEGRNFRLDESDFITKMSTNIFGIMNFSSQIQGKVTEPDMAMRGSITETVLNEQETPSSFFDLKIKKHLMEGNANLFGHRIQADWLLPFGESPMRFRLKTVDWNYASLLAILTGNPYQNEYDSSLTADVDLNSENGQWQKASGSIQIKNLFLKRSSLSFRNPDPIQIRLDHGKIRIQNFNLEGPQNSIHLKGQDFTFNNMNVNLVANTELRLFHMFFPFLDDLGGSVQASATVSGSLLKPQILGSLSTNNSFVKIKGLPHPIERIQTEVSFSQTRVLINSVKAQMAGGLVSADGNITINGPRDLPISIRINLDGVNLNIPEKVRTSGSADLLLSGKWFPFLLSGTYRVSSGIFEREFTDDSGNTLAMSRQSIYLPKILRQSAFESLILDVQILFEKSFLVKNSLVDGSVQGNLQVKGPISNPILLGRLQADKNTRLIFKDKEFEVQTANVLFNNPDEINPDLYVSAQARVSDYDIMILAQGPAKNLKSLRLSSVPPLPEQDIISLLALGITSNRFDSTAQGRSGEQSAQAGYELGFAIFNQSINKISQGSLGLNVQVSTFYDSTRNISVPKLTLSRKITNRINASASRTMGSEVSDVEVKLRYLINNNVSAIGSYENTQTLQGGQGLTTTSRPKENVFGLDLEFRKEFK